MQSDWAHDGGAYDTESVREVFRGERGDERRGGGTLGSPPERADVEEVGSGAEDRPALRLLFHGPRQHPREACVAPSNRSLRCAWCGEPLPIESLGAVYRKIDEFRWVGWHAEYGVNLMSTHCFQQDTGRGVSDEDLVELVEARGYFRVAVPPWYR